MVRDDSSAPRPGLADLFGEVCDLPAASRDRRLREISLDDPALAAQLAQMLAIDATDTGPLERARDVVAAGVERQLLTAPVAAAPDQLGPWRLGERLGAGGMGEVFHGERSEGGFTQRAAVKIVRAGMASDGVVARFLFERQVLARLDHPAIARILDGGVAPDGRPWFAMELVEGDPITDFAIRQALSVEGRLRLLIEAAEAVDFAHRSLVVHRDLKPSNLLVTTDGRPKLLDFGLAKLLETDADPGLTNTLTRALTPAYAAPEQILGEPVTTATDVYSLGMLLYELLTGELPNQRMSPTPGGLAQEVARESVERPSTRVRRSRVMHSDANRRARRMEGDLDTIALRALAREPTRRYASAAALADDLRRHLDGRPVTARPDTRAYRFGKFVRRHRAAVTAAVAALLFLVIGLTTALLQANLAHRAAAQAEAETDRARREGERATRMKDFLLSVFQEASPLQRARGEPLSIEELLDAAEARIDDELASEPLLQADLWDDLAETRASAGNLDRAATLIDKALATKRSHLPADDLSLVESLVNRGAIANLAEQPETALESFDEAAQILTRRGEADTDPATAIAINRVHALLLLDRNDEAAAESERAYSLTTRWRPGSPDAAMQRHNAGLIAVRRGRYEEARTHFERALSELEAIVGPDHALVRFPLVGLAGLYETHLGDVASALPLYERAFAITLLRFPEGSPARGRAADDLERARDKLVAGR